MRRAARAEEALVAGEGAVDELVDDDEIAGCHLLLQAADRRKRDDVGDAAALQRVDIGAEVDLRGRPRMAAAVARQEDHLLPAEAAEAELIRRGAERRCDMAP